MNNLKEDDNMAKNIAFRTDGFLVLKPHEVNFEVLVDWFISHQNDYVYVVDNGKILGIINGQNFEKTLSNKNPKLTIETEFASIENESNVNLFQIYDIFLKDLTLKHLPVINNGSLVGEYYDTIRCRENAERYQIKNIIPIIQAFYKEVSAFFIKRKIYSLTVIVDKKDKYTQKIISSIPNIEFFFIYSYSEIKDRDMIVLDLKYPEEYRKYYNGTKNVYLIFDIMAEVLLDAFLSFCEKNRISILGLYAIGKEDISFLSDRDCNTIFQNKVIYDVLNDVNYLKKFYRTNLSYKYATSKTLGPLGSREVIHNGLYNHLVDCQTPYINVSCGIRHTTGNPSCWEKEIHIYGPCIAQGICVTDEYTVASYLQKKLNRLHNNKFKVLNHGAVTHTPYASFCNDILTAMDTVLHSGDIIIFFDAFTKEILDLLSSRGIEIIRDNKMFDGTANYFLNNTYHCNHLANQKYASLLFEYLKRKSLLIVDEESLLASTFFCDQKIDLGFKNDSFLNNLELLNYVDYIQRIYRLPNAGQLKIAAICTHANPFTKGHYELTIKAAKEMDHVYIFVVQESLSSIPFMIRMNIVKEATKNIKNVTVLSSGTYMASYKTFPDYFTIAKTKNEFNEKSMVMDTRIFSTLFCEALGINYRYLGEEPLDPYTNKMNQYYLDVLPTYGIKPVLVKRAKQGDKYISGSLVRELIKKGNYECAQKYATDYAVEQLRRYYEYYNSLST